MGKTLIAENMFPEIVKLYNTEGKTAAYDMIRSEFGVKRPYFVLRRIKASGKYTYDEATDRFIAEGEYAGDDVFMDLDELCGETPDKDPGSHDRKVDDARLPTMERLVNELINDRLLTLSRYITLDNTAKTILIDQSSLIADGYRVVTH